MPDVVIADAMQVLDAVADGVYLVDRRRRITSWNRAAEQMSGYSALEVIGHRCRDALLNHVDDDGRSLCGARCPLKATMIDGQDRECRVFMHHKEGHLVPVQVKARALRDEGGRIVGAVEVFSDDTTYRTLTDEVADLRSLALLDPLTQLGNRRYLERTMQMRLTDFERYGVPFGVAMIDVDHFKSVNDVHGHDVGDQVLTVLANTLRHALRPSDSVSRFGGEEFVAVVSTVGTEQLDHVAGRLRSLVARTRFFTPSGLINVHISVGATVVRPGDDAESLLHRADQRLLVAKRAGRNRVVASDQVETHPVETHPVETDRVDNERVATQAVGPAATLTVAADPVAV